uniref:Uncharacterized protein n=1 Tax=Oryza meridionalis TaxID=40149 RepID=A0A0E0DAD7_9ORYZ
MPPGADQMWPGVGVPCVSVARSSGRGRTRSSGRRSHLVRQFVKLRPLQGLAASSITGSSSSKGELGDARSRSGETGSGSSSITEKRPPRASRLLHPRAATATESTSSCEHRSSPPPPSSSMYLASYRCQVFNRRVFLLKPYDVLPLEINRRGG